ncbi:MAG: hypothetical protein IPH53_11940 [Flavobacteriales bacterium]|nr:hypothetical protein [Flavobacteriales bacterium]
MLISLEHLSGPGRGALEHALVTRTDACHAPDRRGSAWRWRLGLEGIGATLSQQTRRKLNAEDTVLDALQALGIDERDTEAFIAAEPLLFRGGQV